MGLIKNYLISFLWGFAEATFFFIVPDVFLSYLSVKYNLKTAIKSALFTLSGAFIGGVIIYHLGNSYSSDIIDYIDILPAISPAMIVTAKEDLEQFGILSILIGAFSGVPYKVFAAQAGQLSIPLISFIAIFIPARLIRWFQVIFIAQLIGNILLNHVSKKFVLWAFFSFWVIFYSLFFVFMPN
ncbi:hypothetical protein [Kiloniella antarctica]|uniref:Permease n=1 Tax=Kiloniella antarctica TaxID=1550907 RepID=A0ABW5BNL5_9PROT